MLPSALMLTTTGGVCCCGAAPPTVGRFTIDGATSGAVTMKITSSTSITSMYGTTLMSAMARRERLPRMLERTEPAIVDSLMGLALQDVRELFDEGFEADREAVDIVRVAVVGDHGGDRGEQADGRCRQRFCNAGRDVREGGLLDVREAAECVHDAPHRAEQTDIRADRADRCEEREVGFEHVHFALEGGAHGTARAVENRARIVETLFLALQKLTHARLENTFERADRVTVVRGALIQRLQVAARPEIAFEALSLRPRAANRKPLAEDESPRHQRQQQQQRHHCLRQQARVENEGNDRQILCSVHRGSL